MGTNYTYADALWLAPRALQIAIVIAMLKRHWIRDFPWFFAYSISELVQVLVLVPLSHQPNGGYPPYFYVGWTFTWVSAVFHFAVIYEVFQHLVKRYEAFQLVGRRLMHGAIVLFSIGAIGLAAIAPASDSVVLLREMLTLKVSLTAVQWALLFSVLGLAFYFRVAWPHRLFGIALGLGLYISLELGITTARAEMGMVANPSLAFAEITGYICTIFIWSYYLLVPEPVAAKTATVLNMDLEKWNQELLRLLQR